MCGLYKECYKSCLSLSTKLNVVDHVVYLMVYNHFVYHHKPTQDEFGDVPLHAASGQGHVNVMTVLIQRGADVDYLNKVCGIACCSLLV